MDAVSKLLTRRQALAPQPGSGPAPAPAPVPVVASTFTRLLPTVAIPKISVQGVAGAAGTFISYLFYLSAAAFFIFLLLIFVHFTITPIFSLSPYDKGIIGVSTKQDKELAWAAAPPDSTMKTAIVNPKSCDYTISFDVFVPAAYQPITAPRVLIYRSDAEVIMNASAKTENILSIFPTSNIMAYIDSSKNDLIIYAVTTMGASGVYTKEALPPITNIPQGIPFRLSITFMPNYLEVYVNGKLNATTILKGTPVSISSQFWPPPKSVANAVQVGNFYYWPRALMASELQALVSTSVDFFIKKS
jgi:hypothetical protein